MKNQKKAKQLKVKFRLETVTWWNEINLTFESEKEARTYFRTVSRQLRQSYKKDFLGTYFYLIKNRQKEFFLSYEPNRNSR